jgi:hypothetical protein
MKSANLTAGRRKKQIRAMQQPLPVLTGVLMLLMLLLLLLLLLS